MIGYVLLAIGLVGLGFLGCRAGRMWLDARQKALDLPARLRWTLWGTVSPSRYWWGARIDAMSADQQAELLAVETKALGLGRADSLPCPLCGTEIPHAWTLAPGGQPAVAGDPVQCPRCDFRLDACRHCDRFLPGSPQGWGQSAWSQGDITFGRCGFYKKVQPVDRAYAPDVARQLKARGYEQMSAPMPIQDSMLRPDPCHAFRPNRARMRASKVPWPDARRTALLRLLDLSPALKGAGHREMSHDEEKWLV
jgi:hypothetical protein